MPNRRSHFKQSCTDHVFFEWIKDIIDFLIDAPVAGMRMRDEFKFFVIVDGEAGEVFGAEDF